MQTRSKATNFRSFLAAFAANWLATVSGGLSVPFAFLALYVSNGYQKTLWGTLTLAGLVTASYRLWSEKSRELERATAELETERAKNPRPVLRGDIEQIYVAVYKEADLTRNKNCDVQLYVRTVVHNESSCQTTIRNFGLGVEDVAGLHATEHLGQVGKTCIQVKPGYQDSCGGLSGREIEYMNDLALSTASDPVVLGIHREGWLRFKACGVDPPAVEQGTYLLTATDSFGHLHQVCSRKSPPVGTGELLRHLDG